MAAVPGLSPAAEDCRSLRQNQIVSESNLLCGSLQVPMMHFEMHTESQFNGRLSPAPKKHEKVEPVEDRANLRSSDPVCVRPPPLDAGKQTLSSERKPLSFLANQFVQSIANFEKKLETSKQVVANDCKGFRQLASTRTSDSWPSLDPRSDPRVTDSPAQQSVYPSDDGSSDNKTPSENKNGQGCSTVPSDESLTTEQLRAYKELEQAEMACEVKRIENCLAEERERSTLLQKTFATELIAQKDAHARDVAALEDMITKVLSENRRLSSMVEGLCGQVEKGGAAFQGLSPASTCSSGLSTNRSKPSPVQSGSSGDEASSSQDSKHKHCSHSLAKERTANNASPHPVSSEAEHSMDSEQIPSSDEAPHVPREVWKPKPSIYTRID